MSYVMSSKHRPGGLAPFFHEIENIDDRWFEGYDPTPQEMKYQRMMHKNIEEALDYRKRFEHQWEFAIRRFNLLSDPIADQRLSNVLIPMIKVIINARLSSMTKGEMDVTYIPNYDEEDRVELWRDARRYVNNKCNHRYEMQQAFLTMSLFGSAPLYDGYRAAYKTHRIPSEGSFKEVVARDPKNSMVFTQSLMPWHYLVSGGGRDHHDAPHYTHTAYMDYDQWVAEFGRTPGYGGKPLYMHTRAVRPGVVYMYQTDRDGRARIRTEKIASRKICVNYHFIPVMDLLMIESNGVLNWCGPNPYLHGRSPFSMLRLHPQLEANGGNFAVYGMGDAWLLNGLDTLYQNVMNMFVDNFYFSNSSVIGVPQGLSLDLDDEEFYGGTVIRGAEQMIVSQLGKVDGNAYNFMWKMLNDLLIWASGVPFNQLVPEGSITAYELSKRLEMANERQAEVLRRNESYGFKIHAENQISNIFQFLPQEEFYAVADPDIVDSMVKEQKIGSNDVVYEDGVPVMIRSYPMIETKGRVIEETFVNGLPIIGRARVVEEGRNGRLAARPDTIRPTEWVRDHSIPDVQVDSMTCFGPQQEKEAAETMNAATFALGRNDLAKKGGKEDPPFNEDEIYEEVVKVIRKNPRRWLSKFKNNGTKMSDTTNSKDVQVEMEKAIAERDQAPAVVDAMQQATAQNISGAAVLPGSTPPTVPAPTPEGVPGMVQ